MCSYNTIVYHSHSQIRKSKLRNRQQSVNSRSKSKIYFCVLLSLIFYILLHLNPSLFFEKVCKLTIYIYIWGVRWPPGRWRLLMQQAQKSRVELPDKNTEHLVKFEFQINNFLDKQLFLVGESKYVPGNIGDILTLKYYLLFI